LLCRFHKWQAMPETRGGGIRPFMVREARANNEEAYELRPKSDGDWESVQAMSNDYPTDKQYIARARAMYCNDNVEIDLEPALSQADEGAWVAAWVWVPDAEVPAEDAA
jgi:hypothetical protein